MSKLAVVYPDPEVQTVDVLTSYIEDDGPLAAYTTGVGVPDSYKPKTSPIHLHVQCDGEFLNWHPVASRATVRVTAMGSTPTATKRAAHLAMGCLLSEPQTWPLTGVLPAHDPDTGGELASFTVRVVLRSTVL